MKFTKKLMTGLLALLMVLSLLAMVVPANADNTVYQMTNVARDPDTNNRNYTATGIYFAADSNNAPYMSNWLCEYYPVESDNFKLIRDGVTRVIGYPGRGTIVKFGDTEYYLKNDWCANYVNTVVGDTFILEGQFKHDASETAPEAGCINFDKTFITVLADKQVIVSTKSAGKLTSASGWTSNSINVSVENDVATTSTYSPLVASGIQVSFASEDWYSVGEYASVVKSSSGYSVQFDMDSISAFLNVDVSSLVKGLLFRVNGVFYNGSEYVHFGESYLSVAADNAVEVFDADPREEQWLRPDTGRGWSADGIYVTMAQNNAPYAESWAIEYAPSSAECIKLIRDGVEHNVGITGSGTFVKFSPTEYDLKTAAWTISGGLLPLVDGDILIVDGTFVPTDASVTNTTTIAGTPLLVKKTYITVIDGQLQFYHAEAGDLQYSQEGSNGDGYNGLGGMYLNLDSNNVPYNANWSLRYNGEAGSAQLIRNGVKYDFAVPEFVKYGENKYYLETNKYYMGSCYPFQLGDIICLNGYFTNEAANATIHFDHQYIAYVTKPDGSTGILLYTAEAGHLQNHSNTASDPRYSSMKENTAPFGDWDVRYVPYTTDAIKRVTGYDVNNKGNTGGETIVKISETDYFFEDWAVGGALNTDEILIFDGFFYNDADGHRVYDHGEAIMHIDKTYLYYNGTQWTYTTECPHRYKPEVADATCTEAGKTVYTCVICDDSYETPIAATGHNYVATVTAPTCTAQGYTTHVCSVCGDTYVDSYVDAKGHSYVDTVTAPTCTAQGYTTHVCSVCGDTYVDSYVDAKGHSYSGQVQTAASGNPYIVYTCQNDGSHTYNSQELKFTAASVSLHNTLSVNFKVPAAVFGTDAFTNPRAVFTFGYRVGDNALNVEGKLVGDYYVFECSRINPQQIGDVITATVYGTYGTEHASQTYTYSVAQYCYDMLNNAESSAELKTLLVDILNYGTAAKIYSQYYTEAEKATGIQILPNKDLTDAQKAYGTEHRSLSSVYSITGAAGSATWKAGGLVLTKSVVMRFRFQADSIDGVYAVASFGGKNFKLTNIVAHETLENQYYVYFNGLNAQQLSETVTVTLYDSNNQPISNQLVYSVESYAKNMIGKETTPANFKALLWAMMKYGDTAKAYKD